MHQWVDDIPLFGSKDRRQQREARGTACKVEVAVDDEVRGKRDPGVLGALNFRRNSGERFQALLHTPYREINAQPNANPSQKIREAKTPKLS